MQYGNEFLASNCYIEKGINCGALDEYLNQEYNENMSIEEATEYQTKAVGARKQAYQICKCQMNDSIQNKGKYIATRVNNKSKTS